MNRVCDERIGGCVSMVVSVAIAPEFFQLEIEIGGRRSVGATNMREAG
jgi:hypothetical protein